MSERVRVRVLLVVGEEAEVVADVPADERAEPVRYPAGDVASAVGLSVRELPGKRLTAVVDGRDRLSEWRLA
ncbi:hypothetical protein AB0465_11340 [Streptomyces griseoviridis]|uniref:hypothetical protein n=1 Tax=Streptomyces griseoviridis TaxID=45398 RepID=UPI00345036BA